MTRPAIACHPLFQVALVAASAMGFTFLTDWYLIRSLWNAIWIFGIPALVAVTLNKGADRQALMTILLMPTSIIFLMVTASCFGLYW